METVKPTAAPTGKDLLEFLKTETKALQFYPTGKFLLAANQESNNIVIFRIDQSTGALVATGQVAQVPAPVDIVFVPVKY